MTSAPVPGEVANLTVTDLRCDRCGAPLVGPEGGPAGAGRRGVRFTYHPGSPAMKDDSGLVCEKCWRGVEAWLGPAAGATDECLRCGRDLADGRLVVIRPGQLSAWTLCRLDAVEFLNGLRTVEPKLDPATFAFPILPPRDEPPG